MLKALQKIIASHQFTLSTGRFAPCIFEGFRSITYSNCRWVIGVSERAKLTSETFRSISLFPSVNEPPLMSSIFGMSELVTALTSGFFSAVAFFAAASIFVPQKGQKLNSGCNMELHFVQFIDFFSILGNTLPRTILIYYTI